MTSILDYWFLTPICLVGATVATTVGIGGPVFLTPVFILVLELPPATAVAVALFTQLFGFLSGAVAYWRRRLVDRALAGRLVRIAVPAALAGSVLSDLVPGPLLRRLFGCVASRSRIEFLCRVDAETHDRSTSQVSTRLRSHD